MNKWLNSAPDDGEAAARSALWEGRTLRESGWPERLGGWVMLLPTALLLLLAAVSVCREAGAIHPLYTALTAAVVLCLALLTRLLAGEGRGWLWALALGAVGLRAVFALGWTVYPHGELLTGWNLALELAAAPAGQWSALVEAVGGLPWEVPHALYMSLLIRLFGASMVPVQLAGAVWGGLTCLLTALLGHRLTGSRGAGLTAGVLLACCPTLLFSAGVLSGWPLYTLLEITGLWLLVCRPFGRSGANAGAAGAAWGLAWALRPGLPVLPLAAGGWLLLTLPGRSREERRGLLLRWGWLLGVFLAAWLLVGGLVGGLTGTGLWTGSLTARAAAGLNTETAGQVTGEDPALAEDAGAQVLAQRWQGLEAALGQVLTKVRLQFGSYDYQWARMDRGGALRNRIMDQVMHPALQGYGLVLALLALWGTAAAFLRRSRGWLLGCALALGSLGAVVLLEADPMANGAVLPLMALWAGAPAAKAAEWTLLMAAPEEGKRRRKEPLPPALKAVRLVVSVAVYAAMLALVLVFFTGNGAFIYEAF